jgi:serine/threonine protein kinase
MYSPPDDEVLTFAFDDWSCGVILYSMLTCTLPFREEDLIERKKDIVLNVPEKIDDGISLFLLSLLPLLQSLVSVSLTLSLDAMRILCLLLNLDRTSRASVADVMMTSVWLDSERAKRKESANISEFAQRVLRDVSQV